jgi:hypothetical protein
VHGWVFSLKKVAQDLKYATRGYFKGIHNKMTPMVSDYLRRMALAKIGIVEDMAHVDCFDSHCFCIIANELSKMEREETERARKKKGR